MSLTILSDSDVQQLLSSLTLQDIELLQASLRKALHEYSTGTTNSGACATNQPNRTVIESKNGTTTLFMPAFSSTRIGMKVVTLATPSDISPPPPDLDKPPSVQNAGTTPQGILNLMTSDGKPFGFVNAEEVTAFRTALASSLLVRRRQRVKTITVFGVGKQAYWHVRLALLLHGPTIKKVHFINRDFSDRARLILRRFVRYDDETKSREGWSAASFDVMTQGYYEVSRISKDQIRAADIIFCTTPSTTPLFDESILTNTEGRKKGRLIVAVGSYKKNMIEVPKEVIQQAVKRHGPGHHFHKHADEGGVVVVDTLACLTETGELEGVQPNQSVELGELVMLEEMGPQPHDDQAILDEEDSTTQSLESLSLQPETFNRGSSMAAVMREDSIDSAQSHGSSSKGKTPSRRSSRSSFSLKKRTSSLGSQKKPKVEQEKEFQMCKWLATGNVIYKSVGMGLMDVVVGGDLVKIARERGVGVTVHNF